jgi:1,5-anhydro-D-fructose reductase (1,5-anhydro-D-mannitol-forming)
LKFINGEVRWGIIGCGDYAQRHNVGKFYTDAQKLINDPEVNAIYIATPPAQHEEYAIKSMLAGKPVYIEKPLALNADSCISIRETSVSLQVPATGAYYRRALPLFNKVKSLLEEKRIGTVKLVLLNTLQSPTKNTITKTPDNWRVNPEQSGGGLFHDLAPHQLDLMYSFFGKPSEMKGRSLNQDKINNAPDVTSFEALFNDIFLRGIWAFNVHESAVADTCEIIGDKGMLKFSFFTGATLEVKTEGGTELIDFTNPRHIQQPMIEKVVEYFRGEGENPCSIDDALVSMRMLDSTLD